MKTPEEIFYKETTLEKRFIDQLDLEKSIKYQPVDFKKGGRYKICKDSLQKNKLNNTKLIVELGSGSGNCLMYLKSQFGFNKGIGFDLVYKDKFQYSGCKFESVNLNQTWPLSDKSVDCLLSMMVFEHLFDPWFSFAEVKRILSPNGRAFINLPIVTNIKNRFKILIGRMPTTSVPYSRWRELKHWDGFHLHYFNVNSIKDLANYSGLKLVRYSGCGRLADLKSIFPNLLCGELSFELQHI